MDWRRFLSDFDGRAPRWEYWLFIGLAVGYAMLVSFALLPVLEVRPRDPVSLTTLRTVLGLPLVWPALAVGVRRLHDRNRDKAWIWLFTVFPYSMNWVNLVSAHTDAARLPLLVLNSAATAVGLWGVVELGFLRGTVGDNAFGPDPLPPPVAGQGWRREVVGPGGHRVKLTVATPDRHQEFYYVAESDPERARTIVRDAKGAPDEDVKVVGTILYQTVEALHLGPGEFVVAPRARA